MNVGVFGLGYVGVVNIACLGKLGHTLYGCDIKPHKVETVRSGKSPIYEPGVDELLDTLNAEGRLFATTDAAEVVKNTSIALICVGTPSRSDGTVNLDFTLNTTQEIARAVLALNKKYTVVFRSTIPPGTTESFLRAEFHKVMGEKSGLVEVAFLPEFLREGSAVDDFFNGPRIVIGCSGSRPEALEALFSFNPQTPLVFTDYNTAEFVKYVDNAFHALKIAFVNEAYRVGAAYGIDVEAANRIFLMDKHLNISAYYLRPGLPFGGSCLPKDLRAINHLARLAGEEVPVIGHILDSNRVLQQQLFEKIVATKKHRVTLYGLTFKSGTDDVRESPMLHLALQLISAGYDLHIYDPDINVANLRIEKPEVVRFVRNDLSVFASAALVVVCKKGFDALASHLPPEALVLNFYNQQVFDIPNPQQRLYA